MTEVEVGNRLLLLGWLLTTTFLARGWCVHSFSLRSAPATALAHREHEAHWRHFLSLATTGASVYVGRQFASVALAVAVGVMVFGAALSMLAP